MVENRTGALRLVSIRPSIRQVALVATDFDGTLLGAEREISQPTKEVLRRLNEFDIEFVVVTGRPPRYCKSIPQQTGIPTTLVCANGAVAYDPLTDITTQFATLDLSDARALVTEIRDAHPNAGFCAEMADDFVAERRWLQQAGRATETDISDLIPLLDHRVHKLLVNLPDLSADETMAVLNPLINGRANVMHAGLPFIELMPPGVDKAFGLKKLCDQRRITPEQVVAFGDMPNDNAMLEFAGWGVAVANAHPNTQSVANEVTCANVADGVAKVLAEMMSG
ncbi:MAG TPA: HAD family phosphatase [Acidimicrobiia bacterium]|nr:HAD family phosphatase [Acidimicrobiia bacterium]